LISFDSCNWGRRGRDYPPSSRQIVFFAGQLVEGKRDWGIEAER